MLEECSGGVEPLRPFLWPQGTSLADALAQSPYTLADKPLMAIRLVGPNGQDCPLFQRDRHLLD